MNNKKRDDSGGELMQPRKDYPLLEDPRAMSKILKLIDNNLGGAKVSPLSLSRIRVPSGDDQEFKIETATGVERAATITGVITAYRQARAYWIKPYGTGRGTQPPDCASTDGFTGIGDPGGDCTTCPYAAFNTSRMPDGSQGAGTACKELRQLLVLLPGQMLPHLFSIPPTSLQNFTKYSLNLISSGANYWNVTTKMTLEPAYNAGGIKYARVRFSLYSTLPDEQAQLFEPYHERMRGFLTPLVVDASAYEVVGEPIAGEPIPARTEPNPPENPDIPF